METENTAPASQVSNQAGSKVLLKDMLIPISIVVAGLFVGAGLYLGGAQPAGNAAAPQPVVEADTTNMIDEVTSEDHIRGSVQAQVKVVEYSDFDCPFCERFHNTMKSITAKYSGDEVAWVYRQFPLEQLHPNAPAVAVASECVAELGGNDAFWEFADAYMEARGAGDQSDHGTLIPKIVVGLGIDRAAFSTCFESGKYHEAIQADADDAVETGGRGTPWSIIIGPDGKTYPINGALPQQAVEQLIEAAMKGV